MAAPSTPSQPPVPKKEEADSQLAALQAQPPLIRIKKKLSKSTAKSLKNGKYYPTQVNEMYQGLVQSFGPSDKPEPLIISYEEKPSKKIKKKQVKYVEYNGVKIDREKYKEQLKGTLKDYGITLPDTSE